MHEHHLRVGRTARYAVLGPETDPAAIRELWFVLHGYGQLAADFLRRFTPLDDGTRLIVAPEALNRFYLVDVSSSAAANRPVGATWMTREDREHEVDDYIAYLEAVQGDVVARVGGPLPWRVTVLGFSQGTATAARWVSSGSIRPAHLVLWGGLLPPDLDLAARDHRLRQLALYLVIGSRDQFVNDIRVTEEAARLDAAGIALEIVRYAGGHGIHGDALLEVARLLGAAPNA